MTAAGEGVRLSRRQLMGNPPKKYVLAGLAPAIQGIREFIVPNQ